MSLNSFVTHRSLASARSTRLPFIAVIKPKSLPTMYVPTATRKWAEKLIAKALCTYVHAQATLLRP